ncbi:hypothetical protein BH11PSE5_BH11PSE5_28730 [soil metagenome]|mgnify:CR=1 FL=1|jgi:hypothetical protein|uniref:hypothetical protein n=1 Tax=Sphingobium sp. CECT 9361 TaxID=2845384 RepID=UPI001EF9BC51|nr:hypothetical protein [Sphingobium sp. BS19]GLI96548.1 hypothetical protein Sbs19_03660 [Sphingobium sp. BS19]CAH0353234.1 hypothetical protein SPH9361_02396 [Sphingobium sp. CECT 9361]|tara:strand:+ start:427 stop:654 length:228 start_codon:yes stop_codon:yes gene_type:complete
MIKFILGLLVVGLIVVGGAMALGLLKVEQTRDATLPAVAVKQGTLPAYKADVVKVEVGTRNETVEVPTVNVQKPQ